MVPVITVIVQKHRKGAKVTIHVKIIRKQQWEDRKIDDCVKLSGSYWL